MPRDGKKREEGIPLPLFPASFYDGRGYKSQKHPCYKFSNTFVTIAGLVVRRWLTDLSSFFNRRGSAALSQEVLEETTHLERTEGDEEWQADVLLFRRYRKVKLDQEGACLFTRFYWSVMDGEENAFRHRRQKRVMAMMLN